MARTDPLLPLYIGLGAVGFIALAIALSYNRFVQQRHLVRNAWANVDTELRRRYDLIPNLVSTVKGYAAHEREVLERVTAARAAAVSPHAGAGEQARFEQELVSTLRQLFAVVEGYPELKASANFLALQEELVNTEDRIQAARRFYNNHVRDLNRRVQSVPSNIIAAWFRFHDEDYFEVEPAIRAGGAPPVDVDPAS
jgi:LemA protein